MNEKTRLIRLLRASTKRGDYRPNCFVCNKHYCITELHHLIPVSVIADMIIASQKPVKEVFMPTVWLCPNHHALWHLVEKKYVTDLGFEAFESLTEQEAQKFQEMEEMCKRFRFEVQS